MPTRVQRFSAQEKVLWLERELRFRRNVFPRRVAKGRMTQKNCDLQIAIGEEMLADYQAQVDEQCNLLDLVENMPPPGHRAVV